MDEISELVLVEKITDKIFKLEPYSITWSYKL